MDHTEFKLSLKDCHFLIKKYVDKKKEIMDCSFYTQNFYGKIFNIYNINQFTIVQNKIVKSKSNNDFGDEICSIFGGHLLFSTKVNTYMNGQNKFIIKIEKSKKPFIYLIKRYADKEDLIFDNIKLEMQKLFFEFLI